MASHANDLALSRAVVHGQRGAAEKLYDMVFDPNEMHNLIDHPRGEAVRDELRDRLMTWMHETDDPLLSGPVPGARGDFEHDRDYLSRQSSP